MNLFKLFQKTSCVFENNPPKDVVKQYIQSLKQREETIKKLLKKKLKVSIKNDLRQDLKSIAKIQKC